MSNATGWEPVSVESDGLNLVGERWPSTDENKGTVVLLHGGGQRRFSWHKTGRRLAQQGWTTYTFDARGHGDSDWSPAGDYSMSALGDDLGAIQKLVGEPSVLVGASMGGMTSLIAEGERGGIARGLVLVDIVPRVEPAGAARIKAFMTQAPDGFASLEDVADAVSAYNPLRKRPSNLDGLLKNVRLREDGRYHWHWDPALIDGRDEPTGDATHDRAIAAAARVSVPVMIVRGEESDIVTADGVDELVGVLPNAVAVAVGSAGHMVAGDDNDVFTTKLEEFLATLPKRDL